MKRRDDEGTKSIFRSNRFFLINNQWYFAARECGNVGPFSTLAHAREGLILFLKTVAEDEHTVEHAETVAKNGEWAITFYQ